MLSSHAFGECIRTKPRADKQDAIASGSSAWGAGKPRSARHASRQCRNGSNILCGRLGVLHVSRLIFDSQDRYPGTNGEFSLTDEQIDLVRDSVDIWMKLRTLDESSRVLVASPEYPAVRGRPVIPHGLTTHEGVRMSRVAGGDVLVLPVLMVGNPAVPFSSRLKVDHGLAARGAFAAGRGIGPAYRWLVVDLFAAGQLEAILPDYSLPSAPLIALIVRKQAGIARVRLLVDFLVDQITRIPGIGALRSRP